MVTFLNLPLAIREQIYRLHLVRHEPITLSEHEKTVGCEWYQRKSMPPILSLSRQIEQEAAAIYYGENEFDFQLLNGLYGYSDMRRFRIATYPRHFRLVRKVTVYIDPKGTSILETCRILGSMRGLEQLRVGVNELAMVTRRLFRRSTMQRQQVDAHLDAKQYDSQEQLSILAFPGINGLLSLSGIPGFEFTDRQPTGACESGGLIPGGFLETHVLPRIHANRPVIGTETHKSAFSFLDLPPELRNSVYALLLEFTHPLTLSNRETSSALALRTSERGKKKSPFAQATHSVLSLLSVNRQIHDETIGIFYNRNSFVFYYPSQFAAFMMSLSPQRQKQIKDLTIYYHSMTQGGVDIVDLALWHLQQLSGLCKLHVLLNGDLNRKLDKSGSPVWWGRIERHLGDANPGLLPGMKALFRLRGVSDIKIRDLELEKDIERLKKEQSYPDFPENSLDALRIRLSEVLCHFNEALKMAQLGRVNEKLLEDNGWQTQDIFPALE